MEKEEIFKKTVAFWGIGGYNISRAYILCNNWQEAFFRISCVVMKAGRGVPAFSDKDFQEIAVFLSLCHFDKRRQIMNYDEQNFYVRRQKKRHDRTFAPLISAKKAMSIIDVVFDSQQAAFDGPGRLIRLDKLDYKDGKFSDKEIIHALFYRDYYVDPNIYAGIDADPKSKVTEDEFCARMVSDVGLNENQLYFLLGEIGYGKSAFVNKLLTNYGREWFVNKNLFFIRVSAYYLQEEHEQSYAYLFEEFVRKLIGKTIKVVRDAGWASTMGEHFTKLSEVQDGPLTPKLVALREFIERSQKEYGLRFLFVVDNIDYIFHLDDEKLFLPEFKDNPPAFNSITHFLNLFKDGTKLGKLGVNVLLVLRPDSYSVLKETSITDSYEPFPDLYQDNHAYFLDKPELSKVVQKRIEMTRRILDIVPAGVSKAVFASIVAPLRTFFLTNKPQIDYKRALMDVLPELGSYGLRDVVEFCARYAWVRGRAIQCETAINRFLEHFHAGLIAFILKGYSRFSQAHTRFPNIYLTKEVVYGPMGTEVSIPNYYWIKLLLLKYIEYRRSRGVVVTVRDILNVFAGDGGYPEEVIYHALGCMGRVHGPNIICMDLECGNERFVGVNNIGLTDRGKACLGKIFNTFAYLQLIIEDNQLPLPNDSEILELMAYCKEDYKYLVDSAEDYHKVLMTLLPKKAEQVLLFFEILKYELEFEKELFHAAFTRMGNEHIEINVTEMRNKIFGEIRDLFESLKVDDYETMLDMIDKKVKEIGIRVISKSYKELTKQVLLQKDVLAGRKEVPFEVKELMPQKGKWKSISQKDERATSGEEKAKDEA
ncbi:MAG: hypothetical protein PHQ35_01910 [Phycisphaerae bacterium]|nr:hypothetical protein [Phycisphaerae bacterium]MDD5380399.1 hypothetical protein [Phycisphaerae bacterium]